MPAEDPPTPEEAERRFRELLEDADLREPDEIRYDPENDELVCFWHEDALVVHIELSDRPMQPPV